MISFQSKITRKTLEYFFTNSKEKIHINGLANKLQVDVGNLSRKLVDLEKEGILFSEMFGNQRRYGLNFDYPLLKETKKIFESDFGLAKSIKESLKKVKKLKEGYIFGSFTRGRFGKDSDIDILLIGDHSSLEAKRELFQIEKRLGRDINIIDMNEDELKRKRKNKDEFIDNIFKNKFIKII